MFTQHSRNFLKFPNSIAFIGSSFLTVKFSFLHLFNPVNARTKKRHTGVLLKDIKIDIYGRTVMKHQDKGNLNATNINYIPDKYCSPNPPEKCTLQQCGCDKNCGCPPPEKNCSCPPPEKNCGCPPPDKNCGCSPTNHLCHCPDLICPPPEPPDPPWPVPDIICTWCKST
jgi:hypothetical protein